MDGEPTNTATLTVAQAAALAGVSPKTIYRAIEDGRLAAACLGRSTALRTTPQWITEWIESSRYAPKPQDAPTNKALRPRRPRAGRQLPGYLEA